MTFLKYKTRIKQLREQAKMRQWDLALAADVAQSWLSQLERGLVGCSYNTQLKIAKALDCEVDDVFTRGWPRRELEK